MYYNQRQETERENTRASTAKFEQMRESLTGQTSYVEEDAEDTRVHILHVHALEHAKWCQTSKGSRNRNLTPLGS
jgi:hypothetical protein